MRFRLRRIAGRFRRRYRVIPFIALAFLFFALIFAAYSLVFNHDDLDHSLARSLLQLGLPLSKDLNTLEVELYSLRSLIYTLTGYDLHDPLALLESTLPISPQVVGQLRDWEERPFVFIQELSFAPEPIRPEVGLEISPRKVPDSKEPQVLIYHTHTSEMYLGRAVATSESALAHYQFRNLADPTITGILAAGRHLTNALQSLGVGVLHETRIHTLPSINNSYSNSEKTVREILGKHRDFQLVIDLHRDAGVPNHTTNINGRNVARIVLVVGTAERIPLSHPNFQENLDFAHRIKQVADQMYPGLMRPIQVQKDARYNQHLHPQSVIVELGSVENSLDEALLAAELLANVLAQVL